ncbi:MAG: hypothetical protein BAJALOKI2v1_10090 [Promethearchaeota archaeon]|nr:MAG: hypothetical protein BAJALOKI2v1_10090 [Candidatus Lokiarchaeota archaeon]
MFKKKEGENASKEEIQELEENLKNLKKNINKNNKIIEEKFSEQLEKVKQKTLERENTLKNEYLEKFSEVNKKIRNLKQKINSIEKKLALSQEDIKEHIKNQEEIIMDMIHKFNDELLNYKNTFISKIDDLKSEQDVLKISYSINEKKLLQKIHSEIKQQMNKAVKSKEKEVLMNLWIEELKEIISNFEKLKSMNPKEFKVQINEICNVIDTFKQKMEY